MPKEIPPIADPRIAAYFAQANQEQTELLAACRKLVFQTLPEAKESWKWGVPTYGLKKLVCYVRTTKTHITFGFYNAGELKDNSGRLFGESNPTMRHIKLKNKEDMDTAFISNLLLQSVAING